MSELQTFEEQSLTGLFIIQSCRFLGGVFENPGVGQDSLDGKSVHGIVLKQPGNQVFSSSTDGSLCRVSILHLSKDKTIKLFYTKLLKK